jgi:hypothetical protein
MSLDITTALRNIATLGNEVEQVINANKTKTLRQFVSDNKGIFPDLVKFQEHLTTGPIWDITVQQFLLLASCFELRFVSAQDRRFRPCISRTPDEDGFDMAPNSQLTLELYLEWYFRLMESERKYADQFDKYSKFKAPNPELDAVLKDILGVDDITALCIAEFELVDDILPKTWEEIVCSDFSRRVQVLVYDLIRQLAYNQAVASSHIVPELFASSFVQFSKVRNTAISDLMKFIRQGNDISFWQETHLKNYDIKPSSFCVVETGKKKNASVIHIDPTLGSLMPVALDYDSENHDIVCAHLVLNDIKLCLFSIHTPTDGSASAGILQWCFDLFQESDCTHLFIGIDANTKSTVTKRAVVDVVKGNGGYFSYFNPVKDADQTMDDLLKREKTEKTSMGQRTFGLQSQFGKAGEAVKVAGSDEPGAYVDYIVLCHKADMKPITVIEAVDARNDILSRTNPSDHAPRLITVQIGDLTLSLASFNVAGPNDSMLEYSL